MYATRGYLTMAGDVTQGVLINPFSPAHHNVIDYSARLYIYLITIHKSVFVFVMDDYNRVINLQYKVKRIYIQISVERDLKILTAPKELRIEFLVYFYSLSSINVVTSPRV